MADVMMRMAGRGDDGTAKPVQTTNDGLLKTREHDKIGSEPFVTANTLMKVTVSGNATQVLYETDKPLLIEHLVWVTNSDNLQLTIAKLGSDGSAHIMGDLLQATGGADSAPLTAANIRNQAISLFDINIFEENNYKFTTNKPIHFPHGMRLSLTNRVSTDALTSIRAFGVIY